MVVQGLIAMRGLTLAILLGLLSLAAQALEVNAANEAALNSVRGLGPAATARILEARAKGRIKDWTDLMQRVKGIKPRTATKLSDAGLTVNQQSYSDQPESGQPLPTPVPGTKAP
jgi:competence protein ComEA